MFGTCRFNGKYLDRSRAILGHAESLERLCTAAVAVAEDSILVVDADEAACVVAFAAAVPDECTDTPAAWTVRRRAASAA